MVRYLVCGDEKFIGKNGAYIMEETPKRFFRDFVHTYGFPCIEAAEHAADTMNAMGKKMTVVPAEA